MQLTKLRAAPVLQAEVPPCAPAGQTDKGTASQLIRSVRPTRQESVNLAIMWPECASRSSCHLTRGRPWQRFRPILGRRFGTESRFTFGTTRRS